MKTATGRILCIILGLVLAPCTQAQSARVLAEAGAAAFIGVAARDFASANPSMPTPEIELSAGGRALEGICSGTWTFIGTDKAISDTEASLCATNGIALTELVLATDGLVAVVNPRNTWATTLTLGQLRHAWGEGEARPMLWSRLSGDWPARALKLYGPMATTGLASTYRTALSQADGGEVNFRGDMSTSEDLNVIASGVARDADALGIVDLATYRENSQRLRALAVDIGSGRRVVVSSARVGNLELGPLGYHIRVYVNAAALDQTPLKSFYEHLRLNAARLATEAGLIPVSAGGN